jgi:hypothetical protein
MAYTLKIQQKSLSPEGKPPALLHTAKESWFYWWKRANWGAGNGVQVAEAVGARYCKLTPFFTHI